MHIQFSDEERLLAQQGQPVDVIDPQTHEPYVLIARRRFDQLSSPLPLAGASAKEASPADVIAEGIRLSQEAFRRDLPELLKQKKIFRHWVAYHRQERIGIAFDGNTLLDECIRRGLSDDEFYVGWIDSCELIEEEEID